MMHWDDSTLQGRIMIFQAGFFVGIRNLSVPADLHSPGDMFPTCPMNKNNYFNDGADV
jgi:hypothetical protein